MITGSAGSPALPSEASMLTALSRALEGERDDARLPFAGRSGGGTSGKKSASSN